MGERAHGCLAQGPFLFYGIVDRVADGLHTRTRPGHGSFSSERVLGTKVEPQNHLLLRVRTRKSLLVRAHVAPAEQNM